MKHIIFHIFMIKSFYFLFHYIFDHSRYNLSSNVKLMEWKVLKWRIKRYTHCLLLSPHCKSSLQHTLACTTCQTDWFLPSIIEDRIIPIYGKRVTEISFVNFLFPQCLYLPPAENNIEIIPRHTRKKNVLLY